MTFKSIDIKDMTFNPFTLIGNEWMLITAGNKEGFNTMTASWGGLGVFWGKNAATIYVRPTRYTKEFIDREDVFSLNFFGEEHREALNLCGRVSGRDMDKVKAANLTPVFYNGTTYFKEAKMVLLCKKMYHTDIDLLGFDQIHYDELMYPNRDYHTIYIGEIVKALVKED